jgi:hypothetical protein
MPSGTTTMKSNYDERSNDRLHTVENKYKSKATFDNPVMPQMTLVASKTNTSKYSSFVSQYAKIHGYNYKDALKDPNIKKLYKLHNNRAIDNDYLVKQTYEKPRVKFVSNTYKNVGTDRYIDPRQNKDIYSPVDIQQTSLDQQNVQISRGFNIELKNAYLQEIRGTPAMNTFTDNGFTPASLAPINDSLVKAILNDIIKGKSKNIFEISPFMELAITASSLSSLQGKLGDRKIIEYPQTETAMRVADRFKGPVIVNTGISKAILDEHILSSDVFMLNVASDISGIEYLYDVIKTKNDTTSKQPYDIYLSDTRKFTTMSDFYKTKVGTKLVERLIPTLSGKQLDDLLSSLRGNKTEVSVQPNEETIRNFDRIFNKYIGDQRNLLKEIESETIQGSKRFNDLSEALSQPTPRPIINEEVKLEEDIKDEPKDEPKDKPEEIKDEIPKSKGLDYNMNTNGGTIYYRIINNSGLLPIQKGVLIKTSKKVQNKTIYQFDHFDTDEDDDTRLFYIGPNGTPQSLKGNLKKLKSFVRVVITNNIIENNSKLMKDIKLISTLRSLSIENLTGSILSTDLFNEIIKVSSGFKNNVDYGSEYDIKKEFSDVPNVPKDEVKDEEQIEPIFEPVPPTPSNVNIPSNIPPVEGQGILGSGLTEDIVSFKAIFDPKMVFVGKSGIVNIYKLSM